MNGILTLASRHSEHVVCPQEEPVLSAGKTAFDGPSIDWGTNQQAIALNLHPIPLSQQP